MHNPIGLIPSILRGALASVLFVLLAVSVSENGMAQTVGTCNSPLLTPSFPTYEEDPHLEPPEQCGMDGGTEAARLAGTFFINTDGRDLFCGRCLDSSHADNNDFCQDGGGETKYYLESADAVYCGPRSQCNAVGGRLEDGTNCECDTGNARSSGGVCVLGDTCEAFEESVPSGDTGRSEVTCRPRVAGDCTAPGQEFVSATGGGTCECMDNYEPDGESCVQCTGGQTSIGGGHVLVRILPRWIEMAYANALRSRPWIARRMKL